MTELAVRDKIELASKVEQVVIGGDLNKLSPQERVSYYNAVCQSVGLNPLTRPFDYIVLNSKLTLYARKDATDQLRNIKKVSITSVDRRLVDEMYEVITKAEDVHGRADVDIGVVSLKGLDGVNRANAMMKAVTKSKRRVTLSICGLGFLDETEIETIPDAQVVTVNDDGEIIDQSKPAPPPPPVNGNRPYDPETLRAKLAEWAGFYEGQQAAEAHRNMLAKTLNTTFNGDEIKRYEFCKLMTGKASTKEMDDAIVLAMLKTWMEINSWDDAPSQVSIQEAQTALSYVLKEAGQGELIPE